MASKRRYPAKRCAYPDCNKEFIPYDKRLKYCNEQCRYKYHSDKNYEASKKARYLQKLKQSDDELGFLYTQAGGNQYLIRESDLQRLKVDVTIGEELKDPGSGDILRWYINYGIVADGNMNNLHYYIYHYKEIDFADD